jgi:lysophospholipase L1-like esterase
VVYRKILAAGVGVLAAVLVLEIALRLSGFSPLRDANWEGNPPVRLTADDRQYELIPNWRGRAWGTDIVVNRFGMRGPETRAGSAFRVVVLGDSIAFGLFLDAEQTFPRLLAKELSLQRRDVEVLNLAVPGYDTLQEVAFFEQLQPEARADVVVLQFCLNDVEVASPSLARLDRVRALNGLVARTSRLAEVLVYLAKRREFEEFHARVNDPVVFADTYRSKIDPIVADETGLLSLMARVKRQFPSESWPQAWYADRDRVGRLRHAFAALARRSRASRSRVIVAIMPFLVDDSGGYPYGALHDIVRYEALRQGFEVVDLTSEFMRAGMSRLRSAEMQEDDVHPTAEGHALTAQALFAAIIERQ